ncbi:MAG: RNA polymerase sigma factor RpoD/SigA [Candidatus Omnitrophica bacterium]|nr:RNA polymerase sigma factor RpoD/SigA [Candidatus Omnitrophota bacterium]MBU1932995.1 RNA polymerase sigma factor RpoD/SigA [Candidatus Omnitrophota bacterium]
MDSIKLYLRAIKDIPLLTADQEKSLARKIKRGDKKARKTMIQSNLRLVINIAKRYSKLGVPMMDLIEEGNLGLIKAVKKFNPSRGYRFSTYAAWWIKQYITRAIANQGKTIRIPVYMTEIINRWKRVTEQLTQKYGRKPKSKEIAKKMKLSIRRVREISEVATKISSLDAPIGDDGTGQFMDLIQDETSSSPMDNVTDVLRRERVDKLLDRMNEREKKILDLRFGLRDGTTHTLGETAKYFNITRERVRQIESAALEKLRVYIIQQSGELGEY